MGFIEDVRINLNLKNTNDELIDKVDRLYDNFLERNKLIRLSWLVYSAFVRGLHYSVINIDKGVIVSPRPPDGRKRSKINKIKSWKKHQMARVVLVKPSYEVVPNGTSMEDVLNAQAATAYLQNLAEENKWNMKRFMIISYCIDFGNCFGYLRDYENKQKLTPVLQVDEDGEPLIDPTTGRQKIKYEVVTDVDVNILRPQSVLCDPSEGELDDKFEVIIENWRPLDYFVTQYGNKNIKAETNKDGTYYSDLSTLSLVKKHGTTPIAGATELIYLQKPNAINPKGIVIIKCGKEILFKGEWPYSNLNSYPLVHFRWSPPESGEFWSESPIEDQIPIQKDYNEVSSIILENISNVGHVKWMNPIGSGVESIDDLAGEIVDFNPGFEPRQSAVSTLPHYQVNYLNVLGSALEDVQMFHSVSKGIGTPSVRSAIGLDKLEEEDQTPLGISDAMMQSGFEELAKKVLTIASEKVDTDIFVRYTGSGRKKRIDRFRGDMLNPMLGVKVRMVDEYLRQKGNTKNLILELAHNGLIVDNYGKPDAMRVMKLLQFALPDMVYDKDDTQREIQLDENDLLMEGTEVPIVEEWHNHFIHLDVIEELLNSIEFRSRSKEDEPLKRRILTHREQHKVMLQNALMGAAQNNNDQSQGEKAPNGA